MTSRSGEAVIQRVLAFAVHVFTASGAALALLALVLATAEQWEAMFLTLGVALLVDGVDGPLARRLNVGEVLPRWSGETLDLVVDFLTYVFVPAYAIAGSGLLTPALSFACAAVIVITGALYFSDRNMKTDDNYFLGFPAVWNLIAFYFFALQPTGWLAVAIVIAFAALTFVPIRFIHPLRVSRLRQLNLALLALWTALALITLGSGFDAEPWVRAGLAVMAIYFFAFGLLPRRS